MALLAIPPLMHAGAGLLVAAGVGFLLALPFMLALAVITWKQGRRAATSGTDELSERLSLPASPIVSQRLCLRY
jgi:hypothetical protein